MGLRTPFWDRAILIVILNLTITFGRIHTSQQIKFKTTITCH
jgi:hypothetical protein